MIRPNIYKDTRFMIAIVVIISIVIQFIQCPRSMAEKPFRGRVFYDDFEDEDYTTNPSWTADYNRGNISVDRYQGDHWVKLVPDSDFTTVETLYLISEDIYYNGNGTLTFEYLIKGFDSSQSDLLFVDIYADDGSGTKRWHEKIWQSNENTDGDTMVQITIDLSWALGTEGIRVRFGVIANYYTGRDYSNDDRAYIDDVIIDATSTLNTPPSQPNPTLPTNGSVIDTLNPTLVWTEAIDNDGDPITYDVEVYLNSSELSTKVFSVYDFAATSVTVDSGLEYDTTYVWHVRAYDGTDYSAWSGWMYFTTPTLNTPPPAPTLINPVSGAVVMSRSPLLEWAAVSDPDGDPITYHIQLKAEGETWAYPTYEVENITNTSHRIDTILMNEYAYVWRVRAYDGTDFGPWSTEESFIVSANYPPEPPKLLSPTQTGNKTPQLKWSGYSDSNDDELTFYIRIGTTENGTEVLPYTHVLHDYYNVTTPLAIGLYYVGIISNDGLENSTEFIGTLSIINFPPKPPTELNPTDLSLKYQKVSWEGSVDPDGDPIDHYTVAVKDGNELLHMITTYNNSLDFIEVGYPLKEGYYTINISASDPYGATSQWYSNTIVVKDNLPPYPPTRLIETVFATRNVTLQWIGAWDLDGDDLGYWVKVEQGAKICVPWHYVNTNKTNFVDTFPNGNYTLHVYSFDGLENSTTEFIADFQVINVNLPPSRPYGLWPNETHNTRPELVWNESIDPEGMKVSYLIRITTEDGNEIIPWIKVGYNNTYTPDFPLDFGTYIVYIRATDGSVPSEIYSAYINITPIPDLPPYWLPGTVTVVNDGNDIYITWPEAIDPEGADVEYFIEVLPISASGSVIKNRSVGKDNMYPLPMDFKEGIYDIYVYGTDGNNIITIKGQCEIEARRYTVSYTIYPNTISAYAGSHVYVYLRITNEGNMNNEIMVELKNAMWLNNVNVYDEVKNELGPWIFNVVVKPNEMRNITIAFTLPETTNEGTYTIIFVCKNKMTEAEDEVTLTLNVAAIPIANNTKEEKSVFELMVSEPMYCISFLIIMAVLIGVAFGTYLSKRHKRPEIELKTDKSRDFSDSKKLPQATYDTAPIYIENPQETSPMYLYEYPSPIKSIRQPVQHPRISSLMPQTKEEVDFVSDGEVEILQPSPSRPVIDTRKAKSQNRIIDVEPVKEEIKK